MKISRIAQLMKQKLRIPMEFPLNRFLAQRMGSAAPSDSDDTASM